MELNQQYVRVYAILVERNVRKLKDVPKEYQVAVEAELLRRKNENLKTTDELSIFKEEEKN